MGNIFTNFISKGRNLVPMEKRNLWVVYSFVLMGTALDNLNVSASFVSTINIQQRFNAESSQTSWVISAYALTLGSFIILFGKMADILGAHNVFLTGLFFMCLFSLIVAVIENSIVALIFFRALQGIAGAAMMPSAFAITANYFMGPKLGLALKGFMLVLTASIGIGLVLGGAFAETNIGYKGFYYTSFGISFVSFVFLFFNMIPVRETTEHKEMKFKNLDFQATAGVVIGMLLVILGLTEGGSNWKSPSAYVPLPVGVVLLAVVAVFETYYISKYQDKYKGTDVDNWKTRLLLILPKRIFQIKNFWPLIIDLICLFMSYISMVLSLVDYHMYILGDSAILTSVKILPMSVGILIMATFFKFDYAAKVGYGYFTIAMNILCLGTVIWVSRIDYTVAHSYWIFEFVPLFIYGVAINGYFHVYLAVIMCATPLHLQANCSGIFQGAAQLGIALASAICSTIIGDVSSATSQDTLQTKVTNTMYFSIAISVVGVISSCFIKQYDIGKLMAEANPSTEDNKNDAETLTEGGETTKLADVEATEMSGSDSSDSSRVEQTV